MRTRLTSPFAAAAGKDSPSKGHVLYPRRGRILARRWVKGRPSRTPAQDSIRTKIAECATAFSTLSDAQRAAWADLASRFPARDSLGAAYGITDKGLFNRVNIARLLAGESTTLVAPDYVIEPAPYDISSVAISAGNCSITFTHGSGPVTIERDPTADATPIQWLPPPPPAHYTIVGKGVRQPTAPTWSPYLHQDSTDGETDVLTVTEPNVLSVSSVTVWAYTSADSDGSAYASISHDGATWSSWKQIAWMGQHRTWNSQNWSSLGWSINGTLTLRLRYRHDGEGDYPQSYVSALYASITLEYMPQQRYKVEASMTLGSPQRHARENEMRLVSRVSAEAYPAKSASPQTLVIPVANLSWPWQTGHRVAVRITSLSEGFLPGGSVLKHLVVS